MLRGSVIYDYVYVEPKFSAACERRMSGDQGPWELALYVGAMALAGVAWLTLVLRLRWQRSTKRVAALPGLVTLALAGAMAIGDAVFGEGGELLMMLLVGIELSAVLLSCDLGFGTGLSRSLFPAPSSGAVGYDGLWSTPRDG
jgi:hypothetical protein